MLTKAIKINKKLDIESYRAGINFLIAKGHAVIRLGWYNKSRLQIENDDFIKSSNSEKNSDHLKHHFSRGRI